VARHASALKRARQNEARRLRNRMTKTRLKNVAKAVRQEIAAQNPETAQARLKQAQALIDKAAKKRTLHKRTAARKVSRLARQVNRLKAS